MSNPPEPQANLARLLAWAEGAAARDRKLLDRYRQNAVVADQIASSVPLSHATGSRGALGIIESGRLDSFEVLFHRRFGVEPGEREPKPVEAILGTAGSAFLYAAPFRYPGTSCGFLFDVAAESGHRADGCATPFDSGATIAYLRPGDSPEAQVAFVRNHELPLIAYRGLLSSFLTLLFQKPSDYVTGTDPDQIGPIEVVGGDWRRWTFEVRFVSGLALNAGLRAVFLPIALAMDDRIIDKLTGWRRAGIDVVAYTRRVGEPERLEDETGDTREWAELLRLGTEYVKERVGIV